MVKLSVTIYLCQIILLFCSRFLGINCGIVYMYVAKYQMVDEDDYGGIQELLKEGLFTAFAVFMVSQADFLLGVFAIYFPRQNSILRLFLPRI